MVAIKDFEMPNNCYQCDICYRSEHLRDEYRYCPLLGYGVYICDGTKDEDCPLVEVSAKGDSDGTDKTN